MKDEIIRLAKKEKISEVGFCGAADYLKRVSAASAKGLFCGDAEMPAGAKTIVVCAFSYYSAAEKGNISRYAQGLDYHTVARQKLGVLVDFLNEKGYFGAAYADTGPLNERTLAVLSGIAFIGKNHMAINERLGSYFFIGYVITDCEMEADCENKATCRNCGRCAAACPTGALNGEIFDGNMCLSYVTQKKGGLSEEEIAAMKKTNTIWGCDVCQEVCPHNFGLGLTEIAEFRENLTINLKVDENLSNREFMNLYKERAFSWRGKGVLLRNQKAIYNR